MADVDKDFRLTAVSDLIDELRKEAFSMDPTSESKVVDNVLRLLQDATKEVQDMAVKSLGPLVRKVSEQHVTTIINHLTENVGNTARGKGELREMCNSGLKTVLRDVDDKFGEKVSSLICPGIIAGVKGGNQDVVQECLDLINDVLARFGGTTTPKNLQDIQEVAVVHLDSKRNLIKQRAIWVLTNVAKYSSDTGFASLMSALIAKMKGDLKKQGTAIQLVGSIARNVGFRMGKYVNDFVPLLNTAVTKSSSDGDEDIKENAFQACCSFVESCPRDTRPHIDTILSLCLKFLSWDPNRLDDSGSEGEGSGSENEDEDSGIEASEDEDDKTWMVRRAAAKTIAAIANCHSERLQTVVEKAAAELVKQFKERESTARHEILQAYDTLTVQVERNAGKSSAAYQAFLGTVPKSATQLALLLNHKSAETRTASIGVLRSLSKHTGGQLGGHLKVLVPGIAASVADTNQQLRLSALDLLSHILNNCPGDAMPFAESLFAPVEKVLVPGVHSRVVTVGLNACEAFLKAAEKKLDFEARVFKTIEPFFKQTDLDSEAKEAAIRAASRAICDLGSKLPNLSASLDVLAERLGTELTREPAAIAVGNIAQSGISIPEAWVSKVAALLSSFCAPGARSLKLAALSSLIVLFENLGQQVKNPEKVIDDVSGLIDADDLFLAQLATSVVKAILHVNGKVVAHVKKVAYPRVQALLASPLLEGNSLHSISELYGELARLETKGFGFAELMKDLEGLSKAATGPADTHVYKNVGMCNAQVIVGGDNKKGHSAVQTLVKTAGTGKEADRLFAIYTLAEVGKLKDVSEYGQVVETLAAALDNESRVVALAASYGLGSVAVGNLSNYLPFILNDMKVNPKRQLLLLQAVKEIVSGQHGAASALRLSLSASMTGTMGQDIAAHLDTLLPILLQHAASEDDLTRNAVAEVLGRLARIAPERILVELKQRGSDPKPLCRATMVNALRFAITEKPAPELDAGLETAFAFVAAAVADADIGVRLAGLQTITWAVQHKPRVVKPHLNAALPAIYKETVIDPSLIKVLDLGQIKHVTDRGLDKRTAAYELLNVLLEFAFDTITVSDYIDPLSRGLAPEEVLSIREIVFKIVRRLAQTAGGQLYPHLDALCPAIEKELKRPIPKSEPQERQGVMKRAAVAAAIAISTIPNSSGNANVLKIMTAASTGPFKEMYDELIKAGN